MHPERLIPDKLALVLVLIACVMLLAPMLAAPSLLHFRDAKEWSFINWHARFPALLEQFSAAFYEGVFYPRWMPNLLAGNGYPTFVFYQPGAFFTALPFALLLKDPVLATKITTLCMSAFGGYGAFRLAKAVTAGRSVAALVAVLYVLTPYAVVNLYVRGDYSELFAMQWCPWQLLALITVAQRTRRSQDCTRAAFALAATSAAIALTHPFVALHMGVISFFAAINTCIRTPYKGRYMAVLLVSLIGAGLLTVPYSIPVLQLRSEIDYSRILFVFHLWLRPLNEVLQANPLGNTLAVVGLWSWRRWPLARATAMGLAYTTYIQSTHAAGLWGSLEPLKLTQLPYRVLSVDAALRVIAYAYGLATLHRKARIINTITADTLVAAIACLVVVMTAWFPFAHPPTITPFQLNELFKRLEPRSYAEFSESLKNRYAELAHRNDFRPRTLNLSALHKEKPYSRPLVWAPDEDAVTVQSSSIDAASRITTRVEIHKPDAEFMVRQAYMTGWVASATRLNETDEPVASAHKVTLTHEPDGRIKARIDQTGEFDVEINYEGPPYAGPRNISWILSLLTLSILSRRLMKKG